MGAPMELCRARAPMSNLLPSATIRTELDDFVVDEIPAYEPTGEGPHLFLTVRKRDLTTFEAVRRVAAALEIDRRDVGYAGMKDRHAVTTQRLSVPWPEDAATTPVEALAVEGFEVLEVVRHRHKLRTAHLRGNRFAIRLRGLDEAGVAAVEAGLAEVAERGVPNRFGTQRFGREGDLGTVALEWVRGEHGAPRDKRKRRFWFSAFQSLLFNQVVDRREREGTLYDVVEGDLAQKTDTGGMFEVTADELADARGRAARGELSATGPMFGAKMRWPAAAARALEEAVLAGAGVEVDALRAFTKLGEGTRRPLRMLPEEVTWEREAKECGSGQLLVRFVLPKGGYATTVLSRVCRWHDPTRGDLPDEPPSSPDRG